MSPKRKTPPGLRSAKAIQKRLGFVDAHIKDAFGHHQFHVAHFHKPRSLELYRQPKSVHGCLQRCKLRRSVSRWRCPRRLGLPRALLSSGEDVRIGVVAANGRTLELSFHVVGGQGGEVVSLRLRPRWPSVCRHRAPLHCLIFF